MGDQPVTKAEFDGLTATIKVLADQMATLTAKVDDSISNSAANNNNNNRNNEDNNRNNRIIEDSSSSKVEKTDFEEKMSNHRKKLHILREQTKNGYRSKAIDSLTLIMFIQQCGVIYDVCK